MDNNKQQNRILLSIYTLTIALLGLVTASFAIFNLPEDLLGLSLFTLLAALAELTSSKLSLSSQGKQISLSTIIAIASIMLFGPLAGVLTHMIGGFVTALAMKRSTKSTHGGHISWWRRTAFNLGTLATAATIAGGIYVWAGGSPSRVNQVGNILPLFAAASADTLVIVVILIGALTLQSENKPVEIWRQNFMWATPLTILAGVLGGGGLALAYEMFTILGAGVFGLPILLSPYSIQQYIAYTKGSADEIKLLNWVSEKANFSLLEALAVVIDSHNIYTVGHSTQVAVLAEALGDKLNLPPDDKSRLVRAALMHDIGKVGISESLINKPGPLTHAEYNIVKRHAEVGAEIVSRVDGLQDLIPMVRHHHERWDGNGYPDGLEGEQIPLGARILAVANTLDTLCSDRPYRQTWEFKDVLEEIKLCSGTQFDPQVVEAFFALVEDKGREFFVKSTVKPDKAISSNSTGAIDRDVFHLEKSIMPD